MSKVEGAVIIEHGIQMPDGKTRWVVAEVRYQSDKETIHYGKPEILSIKNHEMKASLEGLLVGLIGCKGAFFVQATKAIRQDEKRQLKKQEGKQ
jgi:hypothetical protein